MGTAPKKKSSSHATARPKPAPPAPDVIEASDLIYTHDLKGNFLSVNSAALRLLGYSQSDVGKMNMSDVLPPESLAVAKQALQAKLSGAGDQRYQLEVFAKSGERRIVEVNTRLLHADGQPVGVQGVARDITEQVRIARALSESEAKFRVVAENAPCAIVIYQGSRIRYANPMAAEITGYSVRELVSLDQFWELAAPEHRDFIRSRAAARLRGEDVPSRYEFSIVTKTGESRWMDFTASTVEFEGSPAGVVMVFDVTERKRAENALQKSEELFRTLIEHSTDIITILDTGGQVRYLSPSIERLLGMPQRELIGRNAFEFVHPEDLERTRVGFQQGLIDPKLGAPIMVRLRHRDGDYRLFEAASNNLRENNKVVGLLVSFRDMRERQEQEAQLRTSEERFRQLFERNLAGVYVSTLEGKLLDCNDTCAHFFGYKNRAEILAHSATDLYMSEADRAKFIAQLRREKAFTNLESLCRKKDGSPLWILENVALIEGRHGHPDVIQGTVIDITERKQSEQRLVESESKFRAVAETAASAIYIHDGRRFLYVNHASQFITGYSEQELLNMSPWQVVHPESREFVLERALSRQRGENVPDRYEFQIITKSGETRWVDFSASVINFAGQNAILGTAFDITERKRGERLQSALYLIANRANTAEDLNEFYSSIHHIVSELMYANNFYIALHDEEHGTLTFPYFVDEVDAQPAGPLLLQRGVTAYVLRTGQPILVTPEVFTKLAHNGDVEAVGSDSVDWIGAPLKDGNRTFGVIAVQSYTHDVRYTERERDVLNFVSQHIALAILRKRNEEALRISESRHRSLVQSAVYGIYRSGMNDRFIEVNPSLVNMLGYETPEEVLQLDLARDVYVDTEERQRLVREYSRKKRVENVEVNWKRKDGRMITVRLSGRVVSAGEGFPVEFEMIAEDVTERRALEEQLRQSQKMEAVGRLAGGVAHDFNNLLTVIKGYTELMLEEVREADPLRPELEEIKKAADRAASLTRQLLAFSRQQVLAPKVLDLNQVVAGMDTLLRRLLGEDVELTTSLASDLGRTKADPGQLEQVIMNLAVNARDAMPRGGKLTIETANVELDDAYAREHVGARAGQFVMIAVTDTGTGMTAAVRQRVFEPFFTTKEIGKGTGLGLSTVYGIVKQSEGYIWVYSELGIGTTFKVYLPRVEEPAERMPARPVNKQTYQGTETVLLVEDEDGVRALVRQVLRKHGYSVLEARHGEEALIQSERHQGNIDLLLTDVVLEQMSGRELAEQLAGVRPEMKVLYISGYTDDAIVQHGVLSQSAAFLQKPFTTDALARKIRQVLDAVPTVQ